VKFNPGLASEKKIGGSRGRFVLMYQEENNLYNLKRKINSILLK
jgi:hypothetical protein